MSAVAFAVAVGTLCFGSTIAAESPDLQIAAGTPIGFEGFTDKETVQAAPRSLLSNALAEAFSHSTEGLELFATPGGGTGVDLGGRFRHVLMVRINADGRQEIFCVNHSEEAAKILDPRSVKTDESAGLR
jgi:hypothetical protein